MEFNQNKEQIIKVGLELLTQLDGDIGVIYDKLGLKNEELEKLDSELNLCRDTLDGVMRELMGKRKLLTPQGPSWISCSHALSMVVAQNVHISQCLLEVLQKYWNQISDGNKE